MLILPDGHYAPKALLPQPREYWNPSLSLPRDGLGNPVVEQHWRLTARLHDGHIVWRGRFDDRDDADAFLWAMATGSLHQEPALWRLPTPWWHPDLGELLEYDFSTLRFLTGTSTANQTDTVPADWGFPNTIEVISHAGSPVVVAGGGGGGYSKATNVSLAGGASATYRLAPAGNGNDDAHADWYNGTTLALSSVGIRGGSNGAGQTTGGAGASTTNAIGSTKFAGGAGGNGATACGCLGENPGGGGGAAGPHGAGGAGQSVGAGGTPGVGGTGDNGNTANNANGTQFDATHGSGGGSDGGGINAGIYGGGSGGPDFGSSVSAAGLIFQTYTPAAAFLIGYIPMLFIS